MCRVFHSRQRSHLTQALCDGRVLRCQINFSFIPADAHAATTMSPNIVKQLSLCTATQNIQPAVDHGQLTCYQSFTAAAPQAMKRGTIQCIVSHPLQPRFSAVTVMSRTSPGQNCHRGSENQPPPFLQLHSVIFTNRSSRSHKVQMSYFRSPPVEHGKGDGAFL